MSGTALSVGLFFLLGGIGVLPKNFTWDWWLALVGVTLMGLAINAIVEKVTG